MTRCDTCDTVLRLQYALAKQVPDMSRGCTIETSYGGIQLEPEDSQKVAALVEKLLTKRLKAVRLG